MQPDDEPGLSVRFGRRATAILGSSPRAGARSQVFAATAPEVDGGELVGPRLLIRGAPRRGAAQRRRDRPGSRGMAVAESIRLTGTEPLPVSP